VSNLNSLFLNNPELRRNFRIELSSKRLVTATIITTVFALIVLPSLTQNRPASGSPYITLYLMAVLWSQGITLTLGGAISCWRAVRRERELNTFDYQRITRLSPLELAIGKLFGAPALAYFVTLWLVPPAVVSAAGSGGVAVDFLARSYVLLFTGALVIHAFALMISTTSDKGGMSSGLLLLILLQLAPVITLLFSVSPTTSIQNAGRTSALPFYGIAFPPTFLWATLELGFAAWLMLAVVRNIKLGLEAMQLFSVWEGLGFAAYCNFVWIGFYPWRTASRANSAGTSALLLLAVAFFYAVGIGVLRSRELVRRGLREVTAALSGSARWLGPIGLVAIAAALTEIVIVILKAQYSRGAPGAIAARSLFPVLYFAAWMARDLFYLQWMKIRPVRSSLSKAFLYLGVFYLSTSIVFRSALSSTNSDAAFAACLVPFPLLSTWTEAQWDAAGGMWLLALGAQVGAAVVFAYLYWREVAGLESRPQAASPARVA
jgi:hypothetical protein